LKRQKPEIEVIYIGERGGSLNDIVERHADIDSSYQVMAGKFRRYHGEGFKQLFDVPTVLKNARDFFLVFFGFWQALWRLWRLKPDAVFIKGSLVAVPVGWASALLRIPYVTHDSDTMPGLANRLISRWAAAHAVALNKEFYPYPAKKTFTVGIPLASDFIPVTPSLIRRYKEELAIPEANPVIFVTGGGLGATRLNAAVSAIAKNLLEEFPHLYLLQSIGRGNSIDYSFLGADLRKRVVVKNFIKDLYRYSGAADLIITRGSATALAEFAAQGKSCVVVPNPLLTGGHQLKNAAHMADIAAVCVVDEDLIKQQPDALLPIVRQLLRNPEERAKLSKNLSKLAKPDSASRLTDLLLKHAGSGTGS